MKNENPKCDMDCDKDAIRFLEIKGGGLNHRFEKMESKEKGEVQLCREHYHGILVGFGLLK